MKHTPDGHPRKEALQKAAETVQKIAAKVNAKMAERVSQERLLEIAGTLDPDSALNLVQPHRRVVLETYNFVSMNKKRKTKHWVISKNTTTLFV